MSKPLNQENPASTSTLNVRRQRHRLWLAALAVWISIVYSSTSQAGQFCDAGFQWISRKFGRFGPRGESYSWTHFLAEKSVHVILFTILGMLLWKALGDRKWKIGLIILIGAIAGSASEGLQRYFPHRDPAIRDVLINTASAALGAILSAVFARRKPSGLAA